MSQASLGAAIKTISEKYLGNVLRANDKPGILKWSLRLADYATRLAAIVAPPLTLAEAAEVQIAPADWTGTYDEAYARFLDGSDELLKAAGKPYGREGAERGSMPRDTWIALAEKLGVLEELGGATFFGPEPGPGVSA